MPLFSEVCHFLCCYSPTIRLYGLMTGYKPQICELTHIEQVSPACQDFHPHENLSFTSPALLMFHPHSVIVKLNNILPPQKKKIRKNKNKSLFKEKKEPGKTPLYQRSPEHLTTLCMTSVYFHFFSLSLYHLFFSIVYNRVTRPVLACFDTPSWWKHLVNENVECSFYTRTGRKVKKRA